MLKINRKLAFFIEYSRTKCQTIVVTHPPQINELDILASVSFWPLLIIASVARVSQHVLFTHELLVKEAEK